MSKSKKNVSMMISAAGWICSFVGELIPALRERGMSDEDIHSLVTGDGKEFIDEIANALTKGIMKMGTVVDLEVVYNRAYKESVDVCNFDSNVASPYPSLWNFSAKAKDVRKVEATVVVFKDAVSIGREGVIERLKKADMKPATYSELLAFAERCSPGEYSVYALGSTWEIEEEIRSLCYFRDGRGRVLSSRDVNDFSSVADIAFLAVKINKK